MKWFGNDLEVKRLREEVKELREALRKLQTDTRFYETPTRLDSLYFVGHRDRTVPITDVVYGIVSHLGLEIRKERARPETVKVEKPEDGAA